MARKPRTDNRKPEDTKQHGNSKWRPEFVDIARQMTQCGATMEEISNHLGISTTTFWEWKLKFPDFADAIKDWKNYADIQVEAALFKSAKGFFVEVEEVTAGKVQRYMRYYPPSNTAQIVWLKNRQPTEWRENKELTLKKALDPNADPIAELASSIAALADKIVGEDEPA